MKAKRVCFNARPLHPGPLPRGAGDRSDTPITLAGSSGQRRFLIVPELHDSKRYALAITSGGRMFHPLLGERAGVRAIQITI
jgi:hypothetical protein